jgi:ribosome-binding protein aMBF1 (putative translation factor)
MSESIDRRKAQSGIGEARRGREVVLKRVGRQIVWLRETKGWSRKELARELRVNWERLGRWERGERQLPLSILLRLKAIFHVPEHEIVLSEPMTASEALKGEPR